MLPVIVIDRCLCWYDCSTYSDLLDYSETRSPLRTRHPYRPRYAPLNPALHLAYTGRIPHPRRLPFALTICILLSVASAPRPLYAQLVHVPTRLPLCHHHHLNSPVPHHLPHIGNSTTTTTTTTTRHGSTLQLDIQRGHPRQTHLHPRVRIRWEYLLLYSSPAPSLVIADTGLPQSGWEFSDYVC